MARNVALYHPTIPGLVVTVPAKRASEWTAQGWLKNPPATG